jgi:hypothetical protein
MRHCLGRSHWSHCQGKLLIAASLFVAAGLLVFGYFILNFISLATLQDSVAVSTGRTPDGRGIPLSVAPDVPTNKRRIYPYSVIPGGAQDALELQRTISADRIVAKHFSDFKIGRARVVELRTEKAVYVSYRMGNRVFWTKSRLRLAKGEKLITDGKNYVRTRCGNRISETPKAKTSPLEPPAQVLNPPEDPSSVPIRGELTPPNWGTRPDLVVPDPGVKTKPPAPFVPPGDGVFFPIPPVIPLSGGTPPTVLPPNPPPIPLTPVPEPASLWLMGTGLAGYFAYRRRWKGQIFSPCCWFARALGNPRIESKHVPGQ